MLNIQVGHSYFLSYDPKQWERGKPYPPLATIQVASLLREMGHIASLFDAMLADGVEDYQASLQTARPDVVVIYEDNFNYLTKMCLGRMREAACQMIAEARAHGARVVVAGSDASDHPDAFLAAGADAVLVVTPYYNKPTQEGLYQHFKAINDAIGIPIIIYNIPGRSVIDMSVETMARLFELKNITGVKDATASMVRVSQQRAALGEDFNQLSGEDATVLGYMAHGGHGCISVTSNVAPRLCSEFHLAWQRGDTAAALAVHDKLMPLHTNLFIESNPAPIKYALSLLGKMEATLRLPMVPVAESTRVAVRNAMVHAGLIN